MYKYLIALFLPLSVCGQSIEDYIKTNTSRIATVEPDSINFADLSPIGEAIGNARVVFLGEQDHGDAPTFLAKTRLIKYLHEKKGFDVLAFESDFYGLNEGWDHLDKNTDSIRRFMPGNIFGIWTACDACRNLLYHYVPTTWHTARPLTVSGFDIQMMLLYSYRTLFRSFDSVLRHYDLPVTHTVGYDNDILPLIRSVFKHRSEKGDSAGYNRCDSALQQIRQQLAAQVSPDDFWLLVTDNLLQYNLLNKAWSDYWLKLRIRDIQMAKNLDWLYRTKFAGRKIIVWAHNYHISKYNGHYPEDFMNNAITMGGAFTSMGDHEKDSYIIGFTSYEGEAGRIGMKKYTVPKPSRDSYESWVGREADYAFTDFRKYNRDHAGPDVLFNMSGSVKGNMFHTPHKAAWNKVFDGVFFIRQMYACQLKQAPPND